MTDSSVSRVLHRIKESFKGIELGLFGIKMVAKRKFIMSKNPLRFFFLKLAAMPPAVMLLVIIGLAITVTMAVTSKVSEQEALLESKQSGVSSSFVIMTTKPIPASTEIDRSMIVQRKALESEIWQDAITSRSRAVGRIADKFIPANTQIRESDLSSQ